MDNFERDIIDIDSLADYVILGQGIRKDAEDRDKLDILYRLKKMDKEYKDSFKILIKMMSPDVFQYFEKNYEGMDHNSLLQENLIKLLEINSK